MPSPEIVTHAASPGQVTARRRRTGHDATVTPKSAVPKVATRKPTAAQQLTGVFGKLKNLLLTEWPSIRSMNLGVKSGTGVIDQMLSAQLSQLCIQLHMLVVSNTEAAETLVQLVNKLDEQHFQLLQVLLDSCGHEELSDYLRLVTKQRPGNKASKGAAAHRSSSVGVTATRGNRIVDGVELSTAAELTWRGGSNSTSALYDLDAADPAAGSRRTNSHLGSTQDSNGLRFANLLPPGHLLTKTAEDLQRQHEFQAALKLSGSGTGGTAGAAAAKKSQQQQQQHQQQGGAAVHMPPPKQLMSRLDVPRGTSRAGAHYIASQEDSLAGGILLSTYHGSDEGSNLQPSRPTSASMTWPAQHHEYHRKYPLTGMYRWNSERLEGNAALPGLSGAGSCTKVCQQPDVLWSPLFRAPLKSVEQIWKEGRQATTEAVLTNAKLQVHQSPLDALLLEPPVLLQPRQQPAAPNGGPSSKAGGGKGFSNSRPTSAADGHRPAAGTAVGHVSFAGTPTAETGSSSAGFGSAFFSNAAVADHGTLYSMAGQQGVPNGTFGSRGRRAAVMGGGESLTLLSVSGAGQSAAGENSIGTGWNADRSRSPLGPAASINMMSRTSSVMGTTEVMNDDGSSGGTPASQLTKSVRIQAPVVLGPAAPAGAQSRPVSANSTASRPGSAASTSRLRTATRGDLL